jgi:hypothetical protein
MSAWLGKNGEPMEKALMAWTGMHRWRSRPAPSEARRGAASNPLAPTRPSFLEHHREPASFRASVQFTWMLLRHNESRSRQPDLSGFTHELPRFQQSGIIFSASRP